MGPDVLLRRNHRIVPRGRVSILLVLGTLIASACADQPTDPEGMLMANLSLASVFPADARQQASGVDAWRVQVARPGEGIVVDAAGPIEPNESTVSVEVAVVLNEPCEVLAIGVEMSAAGQAWFRSQGDYDICAGAANDVQVVALEWVRPTAQVAPESLAFTLQERHTASQVLTIRYDGSDGLAWTAQVEETDASWLSLEPASGAASADQSADVAVVADAGDLTPGAYVAHIAFAGEGFPDLIARIPVALTVTPGPVLGLSPASLSFAVEEGILPDPQTLTVTNQGGGTLNWTASVDVAWLTLGASAGSLDLGQSQAVAVLADPQELPFGEHVATISVVAEDAGNSPQAITVTLTKSRGPRIDLSTTALSFTGFAGSNPAVRSFTVSNSGGEPLNWNSSVDVGWLDVQPAAGTLAVGQEQSVTARVDGSSLTAGTYAATITIADAAAANSPQTIAVSVTLAQATAPTISGLSWTQVQLNDETCGNLGTRFELGFDYSDPDGNVRIAGDSLAGSPINLQWWFRPNGFSGSSALTAAVDGTSSSGTVTFEMCIAYQVPENTSVDLTFTLTDGAALESNSLSTNIPRPVGGNLSESSSAPVSASVSSTGPRAPGGFG